jgi:ABC-type phosphate transport system substrate-binding protein
MKTINTIIKTLFVLGFFISASSLFASENQKGVVVVSPDVDINSISKDDLENIFLGRQTIWSNGKRINIAISTQNDEKLEQFLIDNIGQSKRRYKKYWLKKVFSGYGVAPRLFSSNEKALEFAKMHPSTITYLTVDDDTQAEKIKIIEVDGKKYF